MTAAEFAARVPGARPYGRGWRAPCPSHSSRSLTLSIAPSRDDGTVVHCFAGCEASAIVAALGLMMRDLAPVNGASWNTRRVRRQPTQDEVRTALLDEEKRYRNERAISNGERLVAYDLAEIRRSVSVRFGVSLPPVQRRVWDSYAGGFERDELWPTLLERAWREAWIRAYGTEPCCPLEDFAAHGVAGVDLLQAAENLAAAEIRALVKRRATRARRAA